MAEGTSKTGACPRTGGVRGHSRGMADLDRPRFAVDIHLNTLSGADPLQRQLPEQSHEGAPDLAYYICGTKREPTSLDMHVHEGMELGMVLSGREQQQFGSIAFRRVPGDVWLCTMWEPHAWRVEVAQTKKVVLMFLPEFLGDDAVSNVPYLGLFRLPSDGRPRATSRAARARMLSIGREMAKEIENQEPYWRNIVRLQVLLILGELVRLHQQSAPDEDEAAAQVDRRQLTRIMPAVRLVQARPWGKLGVPEAAEACALSVSGFSRLFRHTMGISFGAFSQRARLTFAVQQLLYTGKTVREIADAAGFVDSSHLHRNFVRHYGCSPGNYRARARQRV